MTKIVIVTQTEQRDSDGKVTRKEEHIVPPAFVVGSIKTTRESVLEQHHDVITKAKLKYDDVVVEIASPFALAK